MCHRLMKEAMGVTKHKNAIAHNFMPTVMVQRTHGRQLTGGIARTVERIQQERATRLKLTSSAQYTTQNAREFTELTEEDDNNMMFFGDDEESSVGDDISRQSISDSDGESCVKAAKIVPHIGKEFGAYMRNRQPPRPPRPPPPRLFSKPPRPGPLCPPPCRFLVSSSTKGKRNKATGATVVCSLLFVQRFVESRESNMW